MIEKVKIANFRSIEGQELTLAPLTFLYGNNSAGKSSFFYALNVLKNVVTDPNLPLDSFFNLRYANLGNFRQIVFKHEEERVISIAVNTTIDDIAITYGVNLNPKKGEFFLGLGAPYSLDLNLPITFPYPSNGTVQGAIVIGDITYNVSWNGLVAQVTPSPANEAAEKEAKKIVLVINKIAELIRKMDFVPLKRGFTKPYYSQVTVNQFPMTEDEVASMLITDEYLDGKVNTYLEQTVDRQFRLKNLAGTALVSLTTIEAGSRITTDVVNEGFGINQIVYVLAKILARGVRMVCIEEPEVNLHPGIIRRLPKTFIDVVRDEKRQLFVSTHSEILILSVLSAIVREEIVPTDLAFYLTHRSNKGVTKFDKQEVTPDGQVESGLSSFMTGELEDVKLLFKAKKKKKVDKSMDASPLEKALEITSTPSSEDQGQAITQ